MARTNLKTLMVGIAYLFCASAVLELMVELSGVRPVNAVLIAKVKSVPKVKFTPIASRRI